MQTLRKIAERKRSLKERAKAIVKKHPKKTVAAIAMTPLLAMAGAAEMSARGGKRPPPQSHTFSPLREPKLPESVAKLSKKVDKIIKQSTSK